MANDLDAPPVELFGRFDYTGNPFAFPDVRYEYRLVGREVSGTDRDMFIARRRNKGWRTPYITPNTNCVMLYLFFSLYV